jgi:hypothetical protein
MKLIKVGNGTIISTKIVERFEREGQTIRLFVSNSLCYEVDDAKGKLWRRLSRWVKNY